MSVVMDGKAVAAVLRGEVLAQAEKYKAEHGRKIGLAVILVGNDPASQIYVNNKIKACAECGIESFHFTLPEDSKQEDVLELIAKLNSDDKVQGILIQLPLPKHLDEITVTQAVAPKKDVDGFCYENVGKLVAGRPAVCSCTPYGVVYLLKYYGITIEGKKAVILGRSNIVGKPLAALLTNENATVTLCHRKTPDIKEIASKADILISAVGSPHFVTADMVKEGAVVVDVGINRTIERICGDVEFDEVSKKASYITPVPGGVGPMTIASLMHNVIYLANVK